MKTRVLLLVGVVTFLAAPGCGAAGITAKPPRVQAPWVAGMPQKGVAVYFKMEPGETAKQLRKAARTTFDYVVNLGANSVSLSFPFYTNGVHSNQLYGGKGTPSVKQLKLVVAQATKRRLRVTIRPELDETILVPTGDWRGSILPTDRTEWFASYQRFLKPYLVAARKAKVATFVLGVELNSLLNDSHWLALAKWAGKLFPGELTYSANWNAIKRPAKQLALGVDAYFETNLGDSASVAQITSAWDTWLNKYQLGRRTVLSEVGIAAQSGAYKFPYRWDNGRPLNRTIQQKWFEAACNAFHRHRLAGIYYWRVNLGTRLRANPDDKNVFSGRPAAQAVKRCFQ